MPNSSYFWKRLFPSLKNATAIALLLFLLSIFSISCSKEKRDGQKELSTIVDIESIDGKKAKKILEKALQKATKELRQKGFSFSVLFHGQPTTSDPEQDLSKVSAISVSEPIDLALEEKGERTPIDFINVLKWVGYEEGKGRLTSGLKTADDLGKEIVYKTLQHLASKDNPNILLSREGSKYDTGPLNQTNILLTIDREDYLRINGYRLLSISGEQKAVISASDLRSDGLICFQKYPQQNKIYIKQDSDPAPSFFIDLEDFYSFSEEDIESMKISVGRQFDKEEKYLRLSRENK